MQNQTLSNRLMTAVNFVRKGKLFADIGTDHGYLPIYLYKKGIVKGAIAADVNPMPLESARRNIALHGVKSGIETVLSDGLVNIENLHPDDIAVFGMGGELISRIVGDAPWTKNKNIRLILQPMTKQDEVRRFLLDEGYAIIDEALSEDDGKIYQTICAEYSGDAASYSQAELILGKKNIENGGELFRKFLIGRIEVFRARLDGKRKAGLGAEEDKLIKEFENILENMK